MNAIVYHVNNHKKINGSLFYCFEYYVFLKQFVDIKYILLNTSDEDAKMIKNIFREKYNIDDTILENIINLEKRTDLIKQNIENLLLLDTSTYDKIKDLLFKIKTVRIYSNDDHDYLNAKPNHIFYGWYDFQKFNIRTRLKLYKEIHRTFKKHGNKTLVTFADGDIDTILREVQVRHEDAYLKIPNKHHRNLFQNINKLIYWHSGTRDKNNRSLVEAKIHDLDLEVFFNGHFDDSIKERFDIINNKPNELYLDISDILIQDFIKDCNVSTGNNQ